MLNIDNALKLAEMVNPYLPEPEDDDNVLDFVGKIVSNIRNSEHPEIFADILIFLYDLTENDLESLSGADAVRLFSEGLQENKIISLCEFYQWLMK